MPTFRWASVWSRSIGRLFVRASLGLVIRKLTAPKASRGPTERPGTHPVLRYLPSMTMRWDPILTAAIAAELSVANRRTPVFQAHGTFDPMVPHELGIKTREWLVAQGWEVESHDYPMAHAVCTEEIADIRRWLLSLFED